MGHGYHTSDSGQRGDAQPRGGKRAERRFRKGRERDEGGAGPRWEARGRGGGKARNGWEDARRPAHVYRSDPCGSRPLISQSCPRDLGRAAGENPPDRSEERIQPAFRIRGTVDRPVTSRQRVCTLAGVSFGFRVPCGRPVDNLRAAHDPLSSKETKWPTSRGSRPDPWHVAPHSRGAEGSFAQLPVSAVAVVEPVSPVVPVGVVAHSATDESR